jgi:excisionase family DNA binding protein
MSGLNTTLDHNDLLTPEEVAARLKVAVSWIYDQTRRRGRVRNADPLPHRKMGRYLRFSWSEVMEWLNRQERKDK